MPRWRAPPEVVVAGRVVTLRAGAAEVAGVAGVMAGWVIARRDAAAEVVGVTPGGVVTRLRLVEAVGITAGGVVTRWGAAADVARIIAR